MANRIIKRILHRSGLDVVRRNRRLDFYRKLYKKYCHYTMIPEESFILNLELCDQFKSVPGDYVECGVWRGGMSAAISEIVELDRTIHLFDSFEGLPPAKEIDGKEAQQWQKNVDSPGYFDNCTAEQRFVDEAMKLAKCSSYKVYKGWFDQSLSSFDGENIGILRLDGDWYDSILVCMQQLFPRLNEGGIVVLDDYYTWDGCAKAVHDYLSSTKSPSRIHQWNNHVGYIVKKNA